MITVFLMGGLGNQLFQIFAAFAYAIQYNTKVVLPYEEVLNTGRPRPTYWGNFLNSLTIFTTANPANGVSNRDIFVGAAQYRWDEHHYQAIPPPPPECETNLNILLYGYFQSAKYFREQEDQIMRMMRIEPMKESIRDEYAEYFTCTAGHIHTISMHFRLGDYKDNPCHPVLPYSYYANALDLIMGLVDPGTKARVLYFCEKEDNDAVKEMVDRLAEESHIENFVKVGDEVADWKQMLIMSLCDSHIIANSSFSWWGAYFGSRDSVTCYPRTWFSGALSGNHMGDMFPEGWVDV
jgi:hypothetical protein